MKSPTFDQLRVAALTNVGVWSQVSEIIIGKRLPGVLISAAAMGIAQTRQPNTLPPGLRECVYLLCLPGSLVVSDSQSNCCEPCSKGGPCGSTNS